MLSSACVEPRAPLWLVGDIHLGGAGPGPLAELPAREGPGLGNLEGPLAEVGPSTPGQTRLSQGPQAAEWLRGAGFAALSLENNHALDAGQEGLARSREALRAAGLATMGREVVELETGGLRVGALAWRVEAPPADPRGELRGARAGRDRLLLMLHGEGEPSLLPSAAQRALVDLAVEEGVELVVGVGSHLPGPVLRQGRSAVAHGLGNLVFQCACTTERDGLLLRVDLSPRAPRVQVVPMRAGLMGEAARLAHDPLAFFVLLQAIGSPAMEEGGWLPGAG